MGPVRLTLLESECLQLALQGLSDRAIAERLGINLRPVNAALHRVYDKLGISGRAAAARLIHLGYTDDARPIFYHPAARFGPPDPAADDQIELEGRATGGILYRTWRKPRRGVFIRLGYILRFTIFWILVFAGAIPLLNYILDAIETWRIAALI